jgi:hypothetical protein
MNMEDYRDKLKKMCKKRYEKRIEGDAKAKLRHRMRTNNPMFDPEVRKKVSESMKGNQNARKFHRQGVGEAGQAGEMGEETLETGRRTQKTKNEG